MATPPLPPDDDSQQEGPTLPRVAPGSTDTPKADPGEDPAAQFIRYASARRGQDPLSKVLLERIENPTSTVASQDLLKQMNSRAMLAWLGGLTGGGSSTPAAPKMRNGEPVGPDGYTASEREYMKGAGVDPNAKPAAPAPAPAAPAAPAQSGNMMGEKGLGTRRQNLQQQLDDINQGKDVAPPKPRSMVNPAGNTLSSLAPQDDTENG